MVRDVAGRVAYAPLLQRLPQDEVTQRFSAAWFSRFPVATLYMLQSAPPEVFESIIGLPVRRMLELRRRQLLAVNVGAVIQTVPTVITILWPTVLGVAATAFVWVVLIRRRMSLTPERYVPPLTLRSLVLRNTEEESKT